MKTFSEVTEWMRGADLEFGDPSLPICQLFFRWETDLRGYRGDELVAGIGAAGGVVAVIHPAIHRLPLPIEPDGPRITEGELVAFGAERITAGVWALSPSLNAEQLIHGFVVLYGVPDPAPWERRIVLP